MIDEAVRLRASDIHIEPMADRVRVRYRIDGVCVERDNIPKSMQAPVLARIKIMSGMDIGERRLPQDGRIKRHIDGQDIDFRVSCSAGLSRRKHGLAYLASRFGQYRYSGHRF